MVDRPFHTTTTHYLLDGADLWRLDPPAYKLARGRLVTGELHVLDKLGEYLGKVEFVQAQSIRQGMSLGERLARATLMFHSAEEWTDERCLLWTALTGTEEATTRVLGDLARQVVAAAVEGNK